MRLFYSEQFLKRYRKLKDKALQDRIRKATRKIELNPGVGKPLRNKYKSHRIISIGPFRVIYRIEQNKVLITALNHRKKAYKKAPT